jgi:hypothetical protein
MINSSSKGEEFNSFTIQGIKSIDIGPLLKFDTINIAESLIQVSGTFTGSIYLAVNDFNGDPTTYSTVETITEPGNTNHTVGATEKYAAIVTSNDFISEDGVNIYITAVKKSVSGIDESLYQGVWDATTGLGSLPTPAVENNGFWYDVVVADGIYLIGDIVRSDSVSWNRIPGCELSDLEIKTKYENNANTNDFDDSEKAKLATVDENANNYTLPSDVVKSTGNTADLDMGAYDLIAKRVVALEQFFIDSTNDPHLYLRHTGVNDLHLGIDSSSDKDIVFGQGAMVGGNRIFRVDRGTGFFHIIRELLAESNIYANSTELVLTENIVDDIDMNGFRLKGAGFDEYADNAAAITGGLAVGDQYRTGDISKVVH